jgi:hypothetical protein
LLLAAGCTKSYLITQELERPLNQSEICTIGQIVDHLPSDFDEGNKPSNEQINTFREHLAKQLREKEVFSGVDSYSDDAEYVVTGSVLDYKKGSGLVRFLIGFGAGNAKVTTELKLIRKAKNPDEEDEVIFAGNFNQVVSHWAESGDKTFEKIARDFAKLLDKRLKKMAKEAEKKKES